MGVGDGGWEDFSTDTHTDEPKLISQLGYAFCHLNEFSCCPKRDLAQIN